MWTTRFLAAFRPIPEPPAEVSCDGNRYNNSLRFILDVKNAGADFSQTLTIGRKNYHRLTPQLVEQSLRPSRVPATAGEVEIFFHAQRAYCDGLFTHLRAQKVDSINYSSCEGATVIHDMNTPIPDSLHNSHSVVNHVSTQESTGKPTALVRLRDALKRTIASGPRNGCGRRCPLRVPCRAAFGEPEDARDGPSLDPCLIGGAV